MRVGDRVKDRDKDRDRVGVGVRVRGRLTWLGLGLGLGRRLWLASAGPASGPGGKCGKRVRGGAARAAKPLEIAKDRLKRSMRRLTW